jgi:hypothetical protein
LAHSALVVQGVRHRLPEEMHPASVPPSGGGSNSRHFRPLLQSLSAVQKMPWIPGVAGLHAIPLRRMAAIRDAGRPAVMGALLAPHDIELVWGALAR